MTGIAGRRIAIGRGAVLARTDEIGSLDADAAALFEPEYWRGRGRLEPADRGRGSAWFVGDEARDWVLRHGRRGGLVARFARDRYLWTGERRVRTFAEWRLLAELSARGLPVPVPIAARYLRRGLVYRCDLITRRISGARPLSAWSPSEPPPPWSAVGAAVANLHRAGVDHADLNAHNILLDGCGGVSFIDFDRSRIRADGAWKMGNLRRLRRSLEKIAAAGGGGALEAAWDAFLAGYRACGERAGDAPRRPRPA